MSMRPAAEAGASPPVIGGDRDVVAWADELSAGLSAVVIGPLGCGKSFLLGALAAELRRRGLDPLVVRGAAPLAEIPHGALPDGDLRRLEQARPGEPVTVVVDDAQDLDEATFRTVVRHMADGSADVVFAMTTVDPDAGSSRPPRSVHRALVDLCFEDHVRRHDLRPLGASEVDALVDTFSGGAEIDQPTRTAIAMTARGSRHVVHQLAIEATRAIRAGIEPLDAFLTSPAPGVRDALARQLATLGPPGRAALVTLDRVRGIPYAVAAQLVGADVLGDLIAREFVMADGARWRRLYNRRMVARQAERELGPAAVEALLADVERHVLAEAVAGVVPHRTLCAFLVARRRLGGDSHDGWDALDTATTTLIALGAAREANRSHRPELALACTQLPGVARDDVELTLERVAALHDMSEGSRAFAELDRLDVTGASAGVVGRYVDRWTEIVRWAPDGQGLEDVLNRVPPGARETARAQLDLVRADRALVAMNWDAALTLSRAVLERSDSRTAVARAGAVAATASAFLDRAADSDAMFAQVMRTVWDAAGGRPVGLSTQLWALCLEAYARAVTGRPREGLTPLVERATLAAVALNDPTGLALVDVIWALVSLSRDDTESAGHELRAAVRRASRVNATPWRPLLASGLGLALAVGGHPDEARRALAEADETATRSQPLFDLVRLVAEAEVARAEGDVDHVAAAIRAAHHLIGHRSPVVDRVLATRYAEALALPESATSPSGRRLPPAGRPDLLLTDREAEIAHLVARGLTNRQIAEQLVVSVRTVESHVYQACRKLGVASRRELGPLVAYGSSPSGRWPAWTGRVDSV